MMILSDLVISDAQEGWQGSLPAEEVVTEPIGSSKGRQFTFPDKMAAHGLGCGLFAWNSLQCRCPECPELLSNRLASVSAVVAIQNLSTA